MVQAVVNLNEHENMVLNIVKAKFGLPNKSEAINLVVQVFEEKFLEPSLRPEYKRELLRVDRAKFRRFSSVNDLREEIEHV